jgi:cell division inhibitor SepF
MSDESLQDDQRGGKVSVLHKIGSFFSLREEDDEFYDDEHPAVPEARNVVPLAARENRRSGGEVTLFAPRAFAEVAEIADALRSRQVVILNLQGVDRNLLQRVVDFTSGVAYTLEGRIQKLADAMYLVVPPGVSVNAQGIKETLAADPSFDFMASRG